jgi:hypothetical protein
MALLEKIIKPAYQAGFAIGSPEIILFINQDSDQIMIPESSPPQRKALFNYARELTYR